MPAVPNSRPTYISAKYQNFTRRGHFLHQDGESRVPTKRRNTRPATVLKVRYCRSPFVRAHIPGMLREEPVVSFEVLDSVLAFAIARLVELLDDHRPGGFRSLEMCIYVMNKH